jgi:putative transposase
MRNIELATGSYYHLFNRGVDKRSIFINQTDINRFLLSMDLFNRVEPIGSISESRGHLVSKDQEKLVEFVCYCLNPNHYHFLVKQVADKGIEKFMHKLGNGYTKYFNNKYKRTGSLFGGNYKAVLIDSNEQLLHTSVYVNLNNRISHSKNTYVLSKSSWNEFIHAEYDIKKICSPDIVMDQFEDIESYINFAESSYKDINERKILRRELEILGLDT